LEIKKEKGDMSLLNLLGLIFCFSLGVICVRSPMKIAYVIVLWTKLILGSLVYKSFMNPKLREAVLLMENDKEEYEQKYGYQLKLIKLTGIFAIIISIMGSCLALHGKPGNQL
jgi:hypothetical protein